MMAALISLFFMNLNRMHSVIFMRPDFLFLCAIHITTINTFQMGPTQCNVLKGTHQQDILGHMNTQLVAPHIVFANKVNA